MSARKRSSTGGKKARSTPVSAQSGAGKGDFGVPASGPHSAERDYVSQNTRRNDPGGALPRAGEDGEDDDRTVGAGGNASGVGSSSGGDLDTDLIGFGSGGAISESGPTHRPPGPDDSDGTSAEMASGPPARGEASQKADRIEGSVVQRPSGNEPAEGADSAGTSHGNDDDSFVGEISSDEASGRNDAG